MRQLEKTKFIVEASIDSVVSPSSDKHPGRVVMDYSEGGGTSSTDGHHHHPHHHPPPPHHHHNHLEARQQQSQQQPSQQQPSQQQPAHHLSLPGWQQQQQQPQQGSIYAQQQPQQPLTYSRHSTSGTSSVASATTSAVAAAYTQRQQQQQQQQQQQVDMMTVAATAAPSVVDHDYLVAVAAAQQHQPTHSQYLHYGAGTAAPPSAASIAVAGGYPGGAAAAANAAGAGAVRHTSHHPHHAHQYSSAAAQLNYQQQLAIQRSMMAGGGAPQHVYIDHPHHTHGHHHTHPHPAAAVAAAASHLPIQPQPQHPPPPTQPYLQPRVGRLPGDRPLIKLSVSLIDTYKHINTVYYEERDARRAARAEEKAKKGRQQQQAQNEQNQQQQPQGTNNYGWDDEHYDYIITAGELFYGRYRIKERIGKGSFGQVVRAEDTQEGKDVAIKIIKSKKPFLLQARTEIELLTHLNDKDAEDQHNVVRLKTHFVYRNHQCLVFEMLSLNLYELLKNTQFGGVSLNLIRKFAKQVLRSLAFLARKDVDIIHCDLKPENILLRHPKKSAIKVIDFGSSCHSDKRMYSYIQSRFYRSPEVMLGLKYSVAIDMWSLGCILAEMHTGEPLFSGSDQFDQMQKIVKLLGMVPSNMLEDASDSHRLQFFERVRTITGRDEWTIRQQQQNSTSSRAAGSSRGSTSSQQQSPQDQQQQPPIVVPSRNPIASLTEVIQAETHRKKRFPSSETGNTPGNYRLFVDLIYRMLSYDPKRRIKPDEALIHPFILSNES